MERIMSCSLLSEGTIIVTTDEKCHIVEVGLAQDEWVLFSNNINTMTFLCYDKNYEAIQLFCANKVMKKENILFEEIDNTH